jgi:DNA polymerase
MTTEEYVRDPRFEVIGVGVKVNDHPVDTYCGSDVGKFLKSLDYSDKAILCHHAHFDGAILTWLYGIKPKLWLDTLSMSRPFYKLTAGGSMKFLAGVMGIGTKGDEVINAKGKRRTDFADQELSDYMSYCANDVEITYKMFNKLRKGFPTSELLLIDQLVRMYTEPTLQLDKGRLQAHLDKVIKDKTLLLDKLGDNHEKARGILSSNPKFAQLLTSLGVKPPMKTSPRTGKETFAFAKTDKGMLALLEHDNAAVRAVAQARMGVKSTIEETRTQSLLGVAERGALPVYLNYYGAHTGRLSGGDGLNMQNLPSRAGKAIRQAITAPEGELLVVCDLSQIEARLVAYLAGQEDLVESFRQGRDVYSEFASRVYGRTVTKADKRERFVGKTCILGLGYGMGAAKLRDTLALGQGGVTVELDEYEAKNIVQIYRETYSDIAKLWRISDQVLMKIIKGEEGSFAKVLEHSGEGITMTNGLTIQYPLLRVREDTTGFEYINEPRAYRKAVVNRLSGSGDIPFKSLWGGTVTENFTQGQAGILMKDHMLTIGRKLGYNVRLQVHDEVIVSVPEDRVEKAVDDIREVMSTPPKWAPDLPVGCEIGYHKDYGSVVKS